MADVETETEHPTGDTPPLDALASLTVDQHRAWRMTGDLPKVAAAEPIVDDKAIEKPAAAAKADDKPADDKKPHQRKGLESRKAELDADIADLQAKLKQRAELRAQVAKPDAPAAVAEPKAEPTEKRPKLEDFKDEADPYAAHLEALAEYKAKAIVAEALKADRAERETATKAQTQAEKNQALEQSWKARVTAAAEKHPDFAEKAYSKETDSLIKPGSLIDSWILDSEHGAELLYRLGSDPTELARLVALPSFAQTRALHTLELALVTPAVNTISRTPPPAAEVGRRVVLPGDPSQAALARGDFRAYREAENAKELAATRPPAR